MFSKYPSTTSIIKNIKSEQGYIVHSQYYPLPENKVLFLTKDQKREATTLKTFLTEALQTHLAENTLKGDWNLVCIFPDGSILLNTRSKLIKLCPASLNILASQSWIGDLYSNSVGVIDNNTFFAITNNKTYFLSIYKWNKDSFIESSKTPLPTQPKNGSATIENVQSLGKNRYSYHWRGHNTSEFRISVFEINPNNNEVQELGVIIPKAQRAGNDSRASGNCIALANGQLLTYHMNYNNVQIWDTKTCTCIKEWSWKNIQKPNDFKYYRETCLKIIPFPDCKNLLIYNSNSAHFFLFNTDTQVMKRIKLAHGVAYYGEHHILPNGQVLAFVESESPNTTKIVQFDLPEMISYRKLIHESQKVAAWFLRKNNCPKPIIQYIFSFAFTSESKALLAKKIEEKNEPNCLIM
ncbi:MAG: hypothetical protein HYX60_08330 [Legionella longbeachae]|nr:hypothetical protein [Legionella longbeachae]